MEITEQRREQLRAAGRARAKAFTPEYQRAARAKVKRDTLVAAGKKGFRATEHSKGGRVINMVREKARMHRLQNPSGPERAVIAALDAAGLSYEREARMCDTEYRCVDFLIVGRVALQVHGAQHYSAQFGDTPDQLAARQRADELTRQAAEAAGYVYAEIDGRGTEAEMFIRIAELIAFITA